jgi:energy-coupling factor transport system ATP-binding protein
LKNINFSIDKGGFALVCGRSGSGKTTLAQIIAGILKPTKGNVRYNDKNISDPSYKALRRNIGMIFQTPEQQLFERTVYRDITFVLRRDGGLSENEMDKLAKETVELVGLNYNEYKDRLSFSLSSGEKRKAAIACVLINSPDLIILDEPAVGLDFAAKKSLVRIIRRLRDAGKTIICISHDIDTFLDFSDKIFILKEGEIIFSGDTVNLFDKYEIIEYNVKLSNIFTLLHELKKIDKRFEKDVYSVDDGLLYLKSLLND